MVHPASSAPPLRPAGTLALVLLLLGACGDPVTDPGGGPPDPGAEPVDLFLAVHHEPGPDPRSTAYAARYWPSLVELVAAADAHGHRLTLLLNPQWAAFVLEDPARLAQVRAWEGKGHEVGLHSHGPSMNAWNGYTNQPAFRTDAGYLGGTDAMMAVMNAVPSAGRIRTAAVTDGDSDHDYPAGILYDVDGGASGVADLVSTPTPVIWGGRTMTGLRHARHGATDSPVQVGQTEIAAALDRVTEGQVVGIVFHCFEFHDAPGVYRSLFSFLAGEGVTARTVTDILTR